MPINPTLIYGAGKAINQIGQFLGAKSAAERRQEQIDAEIKRRSATLGTKFIDVNRIQGAADRARIEEAGKVGRFEKALDADVGSFVGCHMVGGSIVIEGKCNSRIAPFMRGGQIVLLNKVELLPGFDFSKQVSDLEINGKIYSETFREYIGDTTEDGKGSIYIKQ